MAAACSVATDRTDSPSRPSTAARPVRLAAGHARPASGRYSTTPASSLRLVEVAKAEARRGCHSKRSQVSRNTRNRRSGPLLVGGEPPAPGHSRPSSRTCLSQRAAAKAVARRGSVSVSVNPMSAALRPSVLILRTLQAGARPKEKRHSTPGLATGRKSASD